MRYANINGTKSLPMKGVRAVCPSCGEPVTAKCGAIVTHHWSHLAGSECDPWAEKVGPWHLEWQNLIEPDSVEVVLAPHRADIVGNNNVVVELQHSPILSEHISARETFYGDMVWLFDATERFELIVTGRRTFFSFQKTKHIELCCKPVFLDLGGTLIEVEAFTDAMPHLSGYGRTRTREWFIKHFLSQKQRADATISARPEDLRWSKHHRFDRTKHASKWIDPETGIMTIIPKHALAIPLTWYFKGNPDVHEWERIINEHPKLANGWTKEELLATKSFLHGELVVIDGFLRVMPSSPNEIAVEVSIAVAQSHLESIDGHIAAGRVPILKDETKAILLEKAKQYEARHYGKQPKPDLQQSLF